MIFHFLVADLRLLASVVFKICLVPRVRIFVLFVSHFIVYNGPQGSAGKCYVVVESCGGKLWRALRENT